MRYSLYLCSTLLLWANISYSQNISKFSNITTGYNQIISIKSRFVDNENFVIQIKLPDNYNDTTEKYPVIYLLDGDRSFGMATDILDWLIHAGEINDAIIVGIGYGSQAKDIDAKQIRDFTPIRDLSITDPNFSEAGGAKYFLSFLDKELIPTIESRYRVSESRILIGFDYGGLFCAYAFFNSNRRFSDIIMISPTLNWSHRFIFKLEEVYSAEKNKPKANIYIINGLFDTAERTVTPSADFAKVLQSRNYPDLNVYVRQYEEETPYSVYPIALQYIIKTILKK